MDDWTQIFFASALPFLPGSNWQLGWGNSRSGAPRAHMESVKIAREKRIMIHWHSMSSAPPKDQPLWLYGRTDCSAEVKPRFARWASAINKWWEEETDCTISDPQAWAEANIPTAGQPMDSAPKDRIIWLFGNTDMSDYAKPRLGRWVKMVLLDAPGWEEEETGCEIENPQWWRDVSEMPALNCDCGCHRPGNIIMHIVPCCVISKGGKNWPDFGEEYKNVPIASYCLCPHRKSRYRNANSKYIDAANLMAIKNAIRPQ